MEQYIPKSAVVAEIERKKTELIEIGNTFSDKWACGSLDDILRFLNAINVKEVDLEEEICTFFSKNPIPYEHITDWPLLKNCAIHFFELGIKIAQKGEE